MDLSVSDPMPVAPSLDAPAVLPLPSRLWGWARVALEVVVLMYVGLVLAAMTCGGGP